ncbi:two-component system regulatory protein YycI [Paenibacillus solisilvae]|uniref:Two-component system regulatory protein YycI n=1 Tax=Paenibacillus solisilvae TaxID=2486751 RepID=A0ABW0W4R1_9BACL
MDWGRAKSVLIFAFLLLNLMLGYQLWSNIREGLSTSAGVNDLPAETLSLMNQKGIKLKLAESIPSETPELGGLTFKLRKGEIVKLKQPVESKIVFNAKELQEGLGPIIPELNKYTFDAAYDKAYDTAFVLYRTVKQLPIFDVKLELYYDNQKITAYRKDVIELVDAQDSPAQSVLPAATILRTLIERNLQNGAVIKDIKLGYHGPNFANSETQVSAPSWRIMLEDGNPSVYYVNAISGEVVTE